MPTFSCVTSTPLIDLAEHDHALRLKLHRRDRERHERLGRDERRRRLIAGVGIGPDAPGAAELHFFEARAFALRDCGSSC